jgi:thymidylate kinase
MRIVCITGIDGAGKTTLALELVSALERQGQPSAYLYGRIYPLLSRLLMALGRFIWLHGEDQWLNYERYSNVKNKTMNNPLLRTAYACSIMVDFFPQIWLKLFAHYSKDRIIVLDRYIYDTVISDLSAHLDYSTCQTDNAIRLGLRILPTPDVTFLVDLPEEVAFRRKDDVPHIDYLKKRRGCYRNTVSRPEVKKINGELNIEEIVADMLEYVNALNGRMT